VAKRSNFHFPIATAAQNGASYSNDEELLCGIVLAGGEGKRLQPFVRSLGRGTLPKQYVNFVGDRSMLEQTLQRGEKLIPSARLLTVIAESHLRYPEVREQFATRPKDTVLVQPENKDTGPGLIFPLLHLYKRYPNSLVVVLPSDHFIGEEEQLMDHVRRACLAVKRDPSKLILLGVTPDREEPEYGYLLPNKNRVGVGPGMFEISWFIEKPDQKTARRVIQAGGLWNTMIMVFKTKTMLHWVSRLAPTLYQEFQQVYAAIGTPGETDVVRNIYRRLRPINFSTEFLEPMVKNYPSTLVALPVPDLLWSDWGTASRIIDVLARIGKVPRLPDSRRTKKIASGNPFDRELLPFDGDFQGRKVAVHK